MIKTQDGSPVKIWLERQSCQRASSLQKALEAMDRRKYQLRLSSLSVEICRSRSLHQGQDAAACW